MAAPRLLDKKIINAEVATQKLQQIKEGITLAKKVDTVRNTLGEEEARLEKFRTESIARVQTEINAKIAEKDALEQQNVKRRAERFALEAPINLKEEWLKVTEEKKANEAWRDRLINEQVASLGKEADNKAFSEVLEKRDENTKAAEKLAERTLSEAQKKFSDASKEVEMSERQSKAILARANEKEQGVLLREVELTLWDSSLKQREGANAEHEVDLSNREEALKVRYETFAKAQAYIKSKKNK